LLLLLYIKYNQANKTMFDCYLIDGLKYSATSSTCTRAIATMMGGNYDEDYVAKVMKTIFEIKARIQRVGM